MDSKNQVSPEVEYLRRCFKSVDGLWFVKVEETHGFDAALDLDQQVWEVMGKIQVRGARKILEATSDDLGSMARCLQLKFQAENYQAEVKQTDSSSIEVTISGCPWLEALKKSNRTHLALPIAERICVAEYTAWANEFGKTLLYNPCESACGSGEHCKIRFTENS